MNERSQGQKGIRHAMSHNGRNQTFVPSESLFTSFNDLGRIQTIEDEGTGRRMDFVYGPDMERWYSAMTTDGQEERTTVYAGNYEKITENGITREYYYLDGGAIVIKENDEFKPYLAFTDNLGSILSVVNSDCEKVFDASYDAWGQQTVTLNEIGLHRGYTGHEMLNEFGIINMNGRLYDPILGRFFSPDNYVQLPDNSQNFNRYSYCLNNPLKYTDPSGEFFLGTIVNALKDFVVNTFVNVWTQGINAWTNADNWHSTYMSWKIDVGLFKGTPLQILSRFTWEAPQTFLGHTLATLQNTFNGVKSVTYYGGATAVETYSEGWGGFTLGSFIMGSRGLQADPNNTLFQHEYGHYLQSQSFGIYYLQRCALPSLFDTLNKKNNHNNHAVEQDANIRAFKYFHEHEKGFGVKKNPNDIGWNMDKNKILGYKSGLDYYNPINQAALRNSLSLGWPDYIFGATIVVPGIVDIILLHQ